MHARASGWSTDGFFGRLMRRVLQLRASQSQRPDAEPRGAGLTGEAPVDGAPAKVRFREPQIEMAHGAGGKASRRLVEGLFVPLLYDPAGPAADRLGDAARLLIDGADLALTTDCFVVTPLRFPGGSIGELAVNGTVNDLAVSGATPVAIVTSFLLEAGLLTQELEAEVRAMGEAARRAGVAIVGGDTKVVEHGKTDRMYITTTGVGRRMPGVAMSAASVRPVGE